MKEINLIFPHQLFESSPMIENGHAVILVEEFLFFRQYKFHQQKIALHRASMKKYADHLKHLSIDCTYIESHEKESDIRELIKKLDQDGIKKICCIDPTDNWLGKRIKQATDERGIELEMHENLLFLNTKDDLSSFFKPTKKNFYQSTFYKNERKKRKILLDIQEQPVGGKWSFDQENREKYPKQKTPPQIDFPEKSTYHQEAFQYVKKYFADHPGTLENAPIWPIDYASSKEWLKQFLINRFDEFGPYEDAIVKDAPYINHSVLTPMLNVGLIRPQEVIEAALKYAEQNNTRMNSVEGFIRQIIGWREFIRGMYEVKGGEQRTKNFWGFHRKIPASFYKGTTGIEPVDQTIQSVLKRGYCHHIERLMILGNFMLLCEFDPDEVYRWFMELFIDAYDWVMVPNVYGMSQFADGGLMSTKPYISGSNYIRKMSNYNKGAWHETWDGLFWRFMHVHRHFFSSNPRLGLLLGTLDRMDDSKLEKHLSTAEEFLSALS
jgi:deoxyribodipyrimidine photolyase-related protein